MPDKAGGSLNLVLPSKPASTAIQHQTMTPVLAHPTPVGCARPGDQSACSTSATAGRAELNHIGVKAAWLDVVSQSRAGSRRIPVDIIQTRDDGYWLEGKRLWG